VASWHPGYAYIQLLLVEDNPGDVKLLQECLTEVKFPCHLSLVSDGEAALAFLARQAPYTDAPRPDLILLDVHLGKKSGWEILEWLRASPSFATIPVVMWTGVLAPADEEERDRLHPTRCLVKPSTIEGYQNLVKGLAEVIPQN
jgi:two-component system, chemotaxis family, response regulator Rcp1